ncbi:MAG: SAM-dependent methyltransferase [Glaciimonas sp.]|nr:SAM-dependent methyltransferase [Glaciimonas sp.]
MAGILYLIPTTLGQTKTEHGNSLTSIIPVDVQAVTAKLGYFIAENAKTARAFLKLINASHQLTRSLQTVQLAELNINTPVTTLPTLLAPLLAGQDAGLISEAGVPAEADPGANLVRMAHEHGIQVRPLVGPSSLLLAMMSSGLNGQSFAFNGYLPTNVEQRTKRIKALELRSRQEKQTQLFIETPYRNTTLFAALITHCQPNTLICVATDLTLPSEKIKTQTVKLWKAEIKTNKRPEFHKKPTVFLILAE